MKKKKAVKKLSPQAAASIAYQKARTAVLEKVADGSLLKELKKLYASKPYVPYVPPAPPRPSSLAYATHFLNLASLAETLGDTAFAKEMKELALDRVKKASTETPDGREILGGAFVA